MTQSQHTQFIGVLMPAPLAAAVKATAAQRGTSVSDLVRAAVARDVASISNPKRPAQPAQEV